MQKQADPAAMPGCSQRTREQEQVIVVDPDRVVRIAVAMRGLGEYLVHLDIRFPRCFIDDDASGERVKKRPERRVAKPVVLVA